MFDLQAYVPFAKLRFRFGSDGGVHEEGWYIDDIQLTGDIFSAAPQLQLDPAHGIEFTLGPNPFNPTTAISYQLSAVSRVSLKVYDVQGREVAELVNGWREAGSHQVTFDGSDLASGIYFCRLEASGSENPTYMTRKMVLVK
ncbi:T9SS type A sorting domain-containing protein [bacterium]|nr:T9SS type A sorting domain-containing protein [bacterium]